MAFCTRVSFVLSLWFLLFSPVWAQDQHTLNRQAHEDFLQADKKLNQTYRALLPHLQPQEKEALVEAELLWIQFRDASARARAEINTGGSLYPMIFDGQRKRTTQNRTAELQEWLDELKSP